MGTYNILEKIGAFLVFIRPWVIGMCIIYLIVVGIGAAMFDSIRQRSQTLVLAGVIGIAIALGAGSIGESLAGIFTANIMHILSIII